MTKNIWNAEVEQLNIKCKIIFYGFAIETKMLTLGVLIQYQKIRYNKKKALKKFDPRTWCTKKPFGYRVIHHGYSLMSCPSIEYSNILKHQNLYL